MWCSLDQRVADKLSAPLAGDTKKVARGAFCAIARKVTIVERKDFNSLQH
jgi:hypothetical protein